MYNYFAAWQKTGAVALGLDMLRGRLRLREGRVAEPSAGVIDSQSVKAAETVGHDSRGFDAGKKINGRKRHIAVDTLGLLLSVLITPASVQDRDGAQPMLEALLAKCCRLRLIWVDGGYAGKLVYWAHLGLGLLLEIIKRTDTKGLQVLPRRWVDALRSFLEALHVPLERMPVELDAQTALYRSLLDGKRLLVLLDNAREDATPISLDLLSDSDARRLLEYRLSTARVSAEPEAVDRLINACANLPLALAMVAARAASNRHFTLEALAAELHNAQGRLDALADEVPDLRSVFFGLTPS